MREAGIDDERRGLLPLAILSLLVGAATGFVCAAFRLTLRYADSLRDGFVTWAHGQGILGLPLVVAFSATATAIAAWMVRRYSPDAVGSGIPQVESAISGDEPVAPLRFAPVKFIGGVLAIGAGLALGREGPSVQIGASISYSFGTIFQRHWQDIRLLLAAGAGAGLATAFNAPIAGAVFVLEELLRRFDARSATVALGASAGAIAVARVMLGVEPDFHIPALDFPGLATVPIHLALGVFAGLAGVAYSRAIVGAIGFTYRFGRFPVEFRAALIGGAVGLLMWFAPAWVGGGDAMSQRMLTAAEPLSIVALMFIVRFALGPISYSAGTPGGLFAPMLLLGTQVGVMFAAACEYLIPEFSAGSTAYAVVGMAAFFTAVVRAPLTGIAIAVEMTGAITLLLPMLAASFAAMAVPGLMRVPPIYETIRKRFP